MADGYVMRANKISSPTETVYWAVINSPDYSALLSEHDPADLSLPADIDYTFETAVDGIAGSPAGFAGGDLNGQYPNPKVIKIQNRSVADINPSDGYALIWDTTNSRWEPKPQNAPKTLNPNRVVVSDVYGKFATNIPLPGSAKPFAVFMENPINSMSFERLTEDMVDPGFSIETTDINLIVGQSITNPALNVGFVTPSPSLNIFYIRQPSSSSIISKSNPSIPLTLLNSSNNTITNINGLSQFKIQGNFIKNTVGSDTYTITASDGVKTISKDISINWLFEFYYGFGADWGTFATVTQKQAFIANTPANMLPVLTNTKSRTISVTCGPNEYIYYAYPASYGDASFACNGVVGGFSKVDIGLPIQNKFVSGNFENYVVWKSNNSNLGTLSITIT